MTEDTVGFLRRENSDLRLEVEHLREEAEHYRMVAAALKEREEFAALLTEEQFPQGSRMSVVSQKLMAVTDEVIDAEVKDGRVDRFRNMRDVAVAVCKMLQATSRTVEGDGSDLPDGAVVTSVNGAAYQLCGGRWWGFHAPTGRPTLPVCGAPYTIIHTPKESANE